jgi:hypothetical protein
MLDYITYMYMYMYIVPLLKIIGGAEYLEEHVITVILTNWTNRRLNGGTCGGLELGGRS